MHGKKINLLMEMCLAFSMKRVSFQVYLVKKKKQKTLDNSGG